MLNLEPVPYMTKLNQYQDEPFSARVADEGVFFRYTLPPGINCNDHWVHVQISKKKSLQAYIHWRRLPGPEKGHYEQMLGDLPPQKFAELLKSPYRIEYF